MKISVIIPTLDEARELPAALARLRGERGPLETEVIVVDGGSSDETASIARASADRFIVSPAPGRARQMHEGALAASGDVLLFLHADTVLPTKWQEALRQAWSSPAKPAATAFRLGFDSDRLFYRLAAAGANWRTSWTKVPHGDQAIAVDREVYFRAGGFPPVPLMEEYLLFEKLRGAGTVRILPQAVRTSTRRYERNGRLYNALRNVSINILFHLGVSPAALARLYT